MGDAVSLSKVWGAALCIVSMSSCELWLDVEAPQCTTSKTCVELLGRGFTCGSAGVCLAPARPEPSAPSGEDDDWPARWACAGEPPDDVVANPDRNIRIRMDAVDFTSLRVPPGLTARACNPADVECSAPVATDVQPGADGFLEFMVPHGFAGFLTFDAPNIVPGLMYNTRPMIESTTTSGPALATGETLMDIAEHSGRPNDDSRGLAILEIRDCNDAAGDGVSFDSVDGEEPFYFDGALPARDLEATTISNLLGAGRERRAVGGFSNLPPGYVTFQIRLAENEEPIARTTLQIRAGHITYVRVYPGF